MDEVKNGGGEIARDLRQPRDAGPGYEDRAGELRRVAVGRLSRRDRRDEQLVEARSAEGAHRRLGHGHLQAALKAAIGHETMHDTGIVAADPVSALDIHGRAIRPSGVAVHVDEFAPIVQPALGIQIEDPHPAHAGV